MRVTEWSHTPVSRSRLRSDLESYILRNAEDHYTSRPRPLAAHAGPQGWAGPPPYYSHSTTAATAHASPRTRAALSALRRGAGRAGPRPGANETRARAGDAGVAGVRPPGARAAAPRRPARGGVKVKRYAVYTVSVTITLPRDPAQRLGFQGGRAARTGRKCRQVQGPGAASQCEPAIP